MRSQPFTLYKRGKIWQYKLRGEKTRHTTGQTSKAKAQDFVLRIITGEAPSFLSQMTLERFTKDFFVAGKCKWLEMRKRRGKTYTPEMTQMRRGHVVNYLIPKFGMMMLTEIPKAKIEDWVLGIPRSNSTRNHIIDTIKVIWKMAIDEGILEQNHPVLEIESLGRQYKARDAFSKEELRVLFPENLDKAIEVWESSLYAGINLLLATTGMRVGEALALKWTDIRQTEQGAWYIRVERSLKNCGVIGTTKNGEGRFVFLVDQAKAMLNRWKEDQVLGEADGLIFSIDGVTTLNRKNVSYRFKRTLAKLNISRKDRNLVPHSFRHTFNTMLREVMDDEMVRKFTGHKTASMTDRYDHPDLDSTATRLQAHHQNIEKAWSQ